MFNSEKRNTEGTKVHRETRRDGLKTTTRKRGSSADERNFGYSAAHEAIPVPLLPSGPGGVRGTSSHRARSSTHPQSRKKFGRERSLAQRCIRKKKTGSRLLCLNLLAWCRTLHGFCEGCGFMRAGLEPISGPYFSPRTTSWRGWQSDSGSKGNDLLWSACVI